MGTSLDRVYTVLLHGPFRSKTLAENTSIPSTVKSASPADVSCQAARRLPQFPKIKGFGIRNQGFPEIGGPHIKDYSALGSILG